MRAETVNNFSYWPRFRKPKRLFSGISIKRTPLVQRNVPAL